MISREEALGIRGHPYYVKPVRYLPTERELEMAETVLSLYERIEKLEDEAARVRAIVDEIDYTHNHWYDTARDEIGRSLFRIRFGPDFEEA